MTEPLPAHSERAEREYACLRADLHQVEQDYHHMVGVAHRYRDALTEIAYGGLLVPAEDFARELLVAMGDWQDA